MPTVADVLRQCGPAYLERYGTTMPAEHKKVLQAIMACRTGKLGMVLYVCESCGKTHAMGRSCGNRHCPTCQQGKTKAWLETQTARSAAVSLLLGDVHRPGRAARCGALAPTDRLRGAVRRVQRRNQGTGDQPQVRGQ